FRRPISICDWNDETVTLIAKVVGKGTKALCESPVGTKFDCLVGLGNGYDMEKATGKTVLMGGGVGVPPLYGLAKKLIVKGITPSVCLGFGSNAECFYEEQFKALGCPVSVSTVDGSYGTKGFVTNLVTDEDYVFTCGPEPMLKAIYGLEQLSGGQFSFEERMGCGFGGCMGCTCKTKYGYKRICKDGPVLEKEEIVW
ncbi:MAG: dihydroorotate dehydrogenase electron transfer subunit, partial [Eubacteriales bacterium]